MVCIRKNLSFLVLCLLVFFGQAQPPLNYAITFSDKANSSFSIDHPEAFLSSRAIERRQKQNIPVTFSDLPITPMYKDSVLKVKSIRFLSQSKWFNTLFVEIQDTSVLVKLSLYPFIASIERLPGTADKKAAEVRKKLEILEGNEEGLTAADYGRGYNQIAMLNGTFLHGLGYSGQNMLIAVIDAGFTGAPEMPALSRLWKEGRVLATYDFVAKQQDVFDHGTHGTYVLSTMAAWQPGTLIGTAPEASYLLLRSEDGGGEYLAEEYFWVAAAEMADSAGADVVNTSLGYSTFDDADQDHAYADMDGNTTFITRGADMAASKGMLVINSAGNSGNADWYYITAPADGDSVLTVGAVGPDRQYASFSSKGPSYDGRIKPNVAAQGSSAVFAGLEGGAFSGSGTSFSSPILAGMAACLWQAHPEASNMDIYRAIEASGDHFLTPDPFTGHGIPDFGLAHLKLLNIKEKYLKEGIVLAALPNPFSGRLYVYLGTRSAENAEITLTDMAGRKVYERDHGLRADEEQLINLGDLSFLPAGVYLLRVETGNGVRVEKVVKQ